MTEARTEGDRGPAFVSVQIVPPADRDAVFAEVGRRLDAAIPRGEGLSLDVPFACWTATRR